MVLHVHIPSLLDRIPWRRRVLDSFLSRSAVLAFVHLLLHLLGHFRVLVLSQVVEGALLAQLEVLLRLVEELPLVVMCILVLPRLELEHFGLLEHADGLAVGWMKGTYAWPC